MFKMEIGVCVRALYYHNTDFSLRLVEWLELNKIMGADKVFMYSFTTHPNMQRVMDYYKSKVSRKETIVHCRYL